MAQQLAADHRKELEAKEQAYQEVSQELAETQKSLCLVIEQAGVAEQQAEQERKLTNESAQALAAYKNKLKDAVE